MSVTNRTHSTRPRSKLYSDIPRPDAPVIYTGAFPILTARPGRRSIYNKSTTDIKKIIDKSFTDIKKDIDKSTFFFY